MIVQNLADTLQTIALIPIAAVTADGNGTGADLLAYSGDIKLVANVSAPVAGTNPTMDLKVQDSADNSSFADVSGAAFTQVTDAAAVRELSLNKDALRRYIRVVKDIGGTDNPQYLVCVQGFAVKKYPA